MGNRLGAALFFGRRRLMEWSHRLQARCERWMEVDQTKTFSEKRFHCDLTGDPRTLLEAVKRARAEGYAHFHLHSVSGIADLPRLERNLRWAMEFCFQNAIGFTAEPDLEEISELEVYRRMTLARPPYKVIQKRFFLGLSGPMST